jgi:hypothetical protein
VSELLGVASGALLLVETAETGRAVTPNANAVASMTAALAITLTSKTLFFADALSVEISVRDVSPRATPR